MSFVAARKKYVRRTIFLDSFLKSLGNCHGTERSMYRKDVGPSWLPTFLLPCPHCGHRMTITSVVPAKIDTGTESNDLEDVTHGCAQCGTTLTRTIRPLEAHLSAQRV
jgi:DNA-directed RNA polymerase subunit RPC12/RpoP